MLRQERPGRFGTDVPMQRDRGQGTLSVSARRGATGRNTKDSNSRGAPFQAKFMTGLSRQGRVAQPKASTLSLWQERERDTRPDAAGRRRG